MARKTKKICVVCGKEFDGTAAAQSCSGACRIALSRIKHSNKRPEYILIAKSKGQKIPDLNAPKGLKFKKGEKKPKPNLWVEESKVDFKETTPESYDGSFKAGIRFEDEYPIIPNQEPPLDKFKRLSMINELEAKIRTLKNEQSQRGVHPKLFRMEQDSKIAEIKEQINQLK